MDGERRAVWHFQEYFLASVKGETTVTDMSGDVVKGELAERLCDALRVELNEPAERLLRRWFWCSPDAPSGAAVDGRGRAAGVVIALSGQRLAAER